MNCEKCSGLLIEYLHSELGPEISEAVKEHLGGCDKCSKELEEYKEIRTAAAKEALPEVSLGVLSRISKAASDDLQKDKIPFWKKWSYSPILVPALTTAIALSVWFYYGYDGVNIGPDVASNTQEMTVETKTKVAAPQTDSDDGAVARNFEIKDSVVLEERSELSQKSEIEEQLEEPHVSAYQAAPPPSEPEVAPALKFAKEHEAGGEVQLPESKDADLLDARRPFASPTKQRSLDSSEQQSGPASMRMQQEHPAMVAQKKKESECDASIKANEAIINSSKPASISAQKESYKSLAQCYEQKGEHEKAVSNYIMLQQVAPEEFSFANSRIEEIKNRIKLDQLRKEQMSDPLPTN